MLERYETHLLRLRRSPSTITTRLCYLRQLSAYSDLLTADGDTLQGFVDAHRDEWKPATQVVAIASIKSFYKWAHRQQHIDSRPDEYLTYPRLPTPKARAATDEQIGGALERASLRDRAMLLLGAECGLRAHEIAKVHTDDRDGEWLTVYGKGGRYRETRLSPELQDILDQLATDGFYFPGRSEGHISVSTVYDHIKRLIGLSPHSLRHRAATVVYRSTRDLRTTQQFLGHSKPETTAIYVHVHRDDLTRAAAAARFAA